MPYADQEKKKTQSRKWKKSPAGKAAIKRYRYSKKGQETLHKYFRKPERIFVQYVNNASSRGYIFGLTYIEFMGYWQKDCYYCGDKIDTIGLDRMDNTQGYINGNVVPCCRICNKVKMDRGLLDFIEHCGKVISHFKMCKNLGPVKI